LQKLVHELEVHQIELEIQNKELVRAKEEAEKAWKQATDVTEKYIELYDFAPTGYFILSKEGNIHDINLSAASIVDKERSLLKNGRFGFYVSAGTLPTYNRFLENIFGSNIKETCEVTLAIDGKLPIHVQLTGIATNNGEQCLVNMLDITQSRDIMTILQRTSAQLAMATLAGGVGLWDYDIVNNILLWDDQMHELCGIDKKNFKGTYETWLAVLHPEDRTRGDKEIQMAIRGEKEFNTEFRVLWPDNTVRHIRASTIVQRDCSGKALRMIGTNWDITQRKQAENALRLTEAKHSSMIANISDVIGIMGADGLMKYKSPNMEKWFGWQPQDLIGTDGWLTVHPDDLDRIQAEFFALLEEDHSVKNVEYRYKCKDGSYKPIQLTATNLVNDPIIGGVLLNYHDITKRKLAEEALLKSSAELHELNATKDKFFSIIAHDLKSPFNAIMGFSNILVEQVREKDYDGIDEYAGYILQSSKRAMNLLSNLMEWSRSQTGRMDFSPEHFELVQFLGDIIPLFDILVLQKSIEIVREFPTNIVAFADKDMLSTVFRNLISNAIKFTQPGGMITMTVTREQNGILISIRDSGIGIPQNMICKLFHVDQSYSTPGTNNEQGTGLGLILCKEFVEKHGGKIWVESEVGKGSTFRFTLPGGE
jgi:PAS domain S-box-containing protein